MTREPTNPDTAEPLRDALAHARAAIAAAEAHDRDDAIRSIRAALAALERLRARTLPEPSAPECSP